MLYNNLAMKKLTPPFVGLLQALGLSIYCALVGTIFWKGNTWFGKMNNLTGPFAMLSLLVVSALICALIALGYPFIVFWDKKNTKKALQMVFYTACWLLLFVIITLSIFALT
jgi:hypothetical protein